jgi:hypothetical protein
MQPLSLLAIALSLLSFAEPPERPPNTGGRSAGSRGCEVSAPAANEMPALMLLVPQESVAKTTETRPTFAWFVRDETPQPMIFRLYQYQSGESSNEATVKRIWERQDTTFVSQSGISVYTLPETAPALTVGQRYLWQVELVCNPNRPSGNLFAEADLQVIAPEPSANSIANLTQQLSAGLWHNALTTAFITPSTNREATRANPSVNPIAALLQQVTTNPTELQQLQQSPIHRVL